ncbi:aprataxin [Phymastichus coffea]|uniref:aprataxin n=1 Tax=Phymastichus coffea TaxID=108790 RepID=UPI00273CE01A|nr:aprataxin [Phymastichus coffea]
MKNCSITNFKMNENHWSFNLIREIKNPKSILEEDEFVYIIKDKYPKSTYHYLIIPKKDIPSISKVTKDDLELLHHMEHTGNKYIDSHKDYDFQMGYHAVPNMYRLHLHVISTDFISNSLKTVRHWNIFNTPYFLPSKDICKELEDKGHVFIDIKKYEKYLSCKLKCHKCSYTPKNMVDLKKHIIEHFPVK